MTRSEFLRTMLKSIFGSYTISVDDDKIVKGESLYQKCSYSVASCNDFIRLFELAFVIDKPMYSDLTPFDRDSAVSNAKRYLQVRDISIPRDLSECKQNKLIFHIFAQHLLPAIIININGKNKNEAQNTDITKSMSRVIEKVRDKIQFKYVMNHTSEVPIDYTDYSGYSVFVDPEYALNPDVCNYTFEMNMSYVPAYKTLMLLRKISIAIPTTSRIDATITTDLYLPIFSGKFSTEQYPPNLNFYPVSYFKDDNALYSKVHFIYKTYVCKEDYLKNTKGISISQIQNDYSSRLRKKATRELITEVKSSLKSFFDTNRAFLEKAISDIISFKRIDKLYNDYKQTAEPDVIKELLFYKCTQLFWDFEIPYYAIVCTYPERVSLGMYIAIQNYALDLTTILNENGDKIAKHFKSNLSTDSFRKHKNFIKRCPDSANMGKMIEFEEVYAGNNREYVKEPESMHDFFYCIRSDTYSSLKSALYKYYDELCKAK